MFARFWKSSLSLALVTLSFGFSAQAADPDWRTANASCQTLVSQSTSLCASKPRTGTGPDVCQNFIFEGVNLCISSGTAAGETCTPSPDAIVTLSRRIETSFNAPEACTNPARYTTPPPTPSTGPENPYPFNNALIGRPLAAPNLEIDIPGVVFTPALVRDGKLTINWIGEYITGVYRYLLGIGVTVAIVMIMIGGVQYTISLDKGGVTAAKKRINDAIIGLILLFSVYLILFTVAGPRLTTFNALSLDAVARREMPEEDEPLSVRGSVATNVTDASGSGIGGDGARKIPAELLPSLQAAAQETMKKNVELSIASSFRTIEKQEELIRKNCKNPPGSKDCDPKPGRPQTCILQGGKAESCPHTTGRALDIWGAKRENGVLKQCISQEECMKNKAACRADACQAAVLAAMKAQGFCNLSSEPWHFEKPKMSSNCN